MHCKRNIVVRQMRRQWRSASLHSCALIPTHFDPVRRSDHVSVMKHKILIWVFGTASQQHQQAVAERAERVDAALRETRATMDELRESTDCAVLTFLR
jgi:hypothetical protein